MKRRWKQRADPARLAALADEAKPLMDDFVGNARKLYRNFMSLARG